MTMELKILILPTIIFGFISLSTADKACPYKPTDVVFVLDGSGSEGVDNFRKQLEFVSNITEQFEIGPNQTRVALVTFGTKVHSQFYLNEITDKTDALNRINSTHYPNGETMTHAALNFVNYITLSSYHGGNRNVNKLVVVLTDGRSVEPELTKIAAGFLKNEPLVTVLAVGIGTSVNREELVDIASDKHHTFQVESFDLLHTLQTELTDTACNICTEASTDVCFVLDSSGSEGADNFFKQLMFISMLVNDFSFDGLYKTRVCVITFSTASYTEIYLNQFTDKHALISNITTIPYRNGETMTHLGLRRAKMEFENSTALNKIAIVLTDGHSTEPDYTYYQAHALQRAGVDMYAVGIGDRVDGRELNVIASAKDHVFRVDSFDKLNDLHDVFASHLCNSVAGTTVPTTSAPTTIATHAPTVALSTESSTNPLISSRSTLSISTSTTVPTISPILSTPKPTVMSTESSTNSLASSRSTPLIFTSTPDAKTSSVLPPLLTVKPPVASTESSTNVIVTSTSSSVASKSTTITSTSISSTTVSNIPTILITNAPITSTSAHTTSETSPVFSTVTTQTSETSTLASSTLPDVSATSSSVKTSPVVTLLPSSNSLVSGNTAQSISSSSSTVPSTAGTTTELIVSATSVQTTTSVSSR
ncbi:hypothetical protein ACF0H5_010208 [Mactra antiquata]